MAYIFHLHMRLRSLLAFAVLPLLIQAQTPEDWIGQWDGTLKIPGMELNMQVNIIQTDSGWKGTLDIPQQMIKDMALSELKIEEDQLTFSLPEVPGQASYEGQWQEGQINGSFSQMGQQLELAFIKFDEDVQADLTAKIERIKVIADSFRNGAEVPGIGLGIIYQNEVLLADGFGYRNQEEEIPVSANTLFAIGSSSKAFTSMGVGLMVDQGLLKWNEPVRKHLRDFQLYDEFATQEMTPVDLLCHRSGLPRHDLLWYASDMSREELYQRLPYLEPSASFRSKWQYQNLMYMTAGILTERLSNQTWETYIEENIFTPLQMNDANFSVTEMQEAADFAYGYGEKDGEVTRLPYHQLDAIGPAGSINASVNDMLKWVELQIGDGQFRGQHFVNSSTLNKMHQPQMVMESAVIPNPGISHPSYGLGWFIYNLDGLTIVEHGGNIDGFSALVFLIPDEQLGLVCLTNKNGTPLGYLLAYTIADILLDREEQDWYGPVFGDKEEDEDETVEEDEKKEDDKASKAPHPLEEYVGTYHNPGYGDIKIELTDKQLQASYYNFSGTLAHQQYDAFKGETEDGIAIDARFETDGNGQIIALYSLLEISLPEIRFERQPDDQLRDPDFLSKLVGEYEFSSNMLVTVTLENSKLIATIPGQPTYTLQPKQGTTFKLSSLEGFTMEFVMEGDKAVTLISHQPNGDFRADRSEE